MVPKAARKSTTSSKKNRGNIWPDEAAVALLELWGCAAKCAKETHEVYRRITVCKFYKFGIMNSSLIYSFAYVVINRKSHFTLHVVHCFRPRSHNTDRV